MMGAYPRASFGHYRDEVEALMESETRLSEVEDAIEATEMAEDHKTVLWLFAWSLRSEEQLRDSGAALALVRGC